VSRNAILLLIVFIFDAKKATEIMMHLWYFSEIPQEMLQAIRSKVYPLIEAVSIKTKDKPPEALVSKKWTFGSSFLRLVFQKHYWDGFAQYFETRDYISFEDAKRTRIAITLAPGRNDFPERRFYTHTIKTRLPHPV
jgi:hypothetical protein